jgi:hypothetical protein
VKIKAASFGLPLLSFPQSYDESVTTFATSRDAKQYLVGRIVEEAKREDIPLSDIEIKTSFPRLLRLVTIGVALFFISALIFMRYLILNR